MLINNIIIYINNVILYIYIFINMFMDTSSGPSSHSGFMPKHMSCSVVSRWHFLRPIRSKKRRVRVRKPLPHVTEHDDHCDHSETAHTSSLAMKPSPLFSLLLFEFVEEKNQSEIELNKKYRNICTT